LSDEQHKPKKHYHFHFLTLAVAALVAAYFILVPSKKNVDQTADAPPAVTMTDEQTGAETSAPPQPQVQENDVKKEDLVVETKSLSIPKTEPLAAKGPAPSYSEGVAAMMGERFLGSKDAPIKVVEYSSLTCGHCAAFSKDELPKIKADYIDTGKVQFIFKEYPLNQPAVVASQVLRCMPEDKFASFMDLLFEQQENWAYVPEFQDKLIQYAKLAGVGEDVVNGCIANTELQKAIIADMQAANESFKIGSTPTFVVNNGEKVIVGHQPYSFFKETFDALLGAPAQPQSQPQPAQ